ncbi:G-type lectin S-receptor-like serine/threonine-protein kinase SD2-2 isoform X2 [Hevea brasiliensis]|uniref:G-type lectin S-receptor-like serine/threonine-protein kinase SD2-2 isoform X2 n=1 Tax=Hevea brasiliensis TaxID=3981 RepID=UPI0025CE23E2|nr:G-type lectin S-receptor-like serine/threonine-protein kinase SD2-2 isoform X2 [Hevea brasiliensis]
MSIPSFTATASSMISVYIFFFFLVTTSDASFVDKFGANERLSAPRITQSPSNRFAVSSNFAFTTQKPLNLLANYTRRRISKKLELANVIISGNITIHSENNTFQLGFFSPHESSKWYLGIWYSSIPTPTYVWVANRETPITKPASCTLQITETGKLAIMESPNSVIWQSTNNERATDFRFLDNGNLVLLSATGATLWQSFNYPTDTWLPGMNITKEQSLTSWRSLADPSPGLYSLRLNPREYNEIELVHNKSVSYWSTGNWTGAKFARVPEMTIEYIYKFHFANPFTPAASFWYTEIAKDRALSPPLTRFQVDVDGRFKQYTWSPQTENWSKFWSQPDNWCKVDRLCGDLGFCESSSTSPKPCSCLPGFRPVSDYDWEFGDYSGGCVRENGNSCNETDGFMEVGVMEYEGAVLISFSGSISFCERSCLGNCSCIGLLHDERTNLCKNLYGTLLNLRNLGFNTAYQDVLFVRVPEQGTVKKNESKSVLLIVIILGSIAIFVLAIGVLLTLQMRRKSKRRTEDGGFPMLNLKVFSYKELYAATRGFSDKLGHGGFGAVFQGRRNVEAPASAGGGNGGEESKKGEIWFFPPYAAQQIIEGNVAAVVDYRLGSAYKIEEAKRVALVAIWCIQDNEDMRPAMGMVVNMLEGVVEVPSPPAPKLLQALISGESYHGIRIDSGNDISMSGKCSDDSMGVSSCGSQLSPANANFTSRIPSVALK